MTMIETSNTTRSINTRISQHHSLPSNDIVPGNEAKVKLTIEGGEVFSDYVDSLGLFDESGLIILSSKYHYYYDCEEVQNSKTIVYIKEFNLIKGIERLLHSHLNCLPADYNFIGCFVNNNKIKRFSLRKSNASLDKIRNSDKQELGIVSRFPLINLLYNLMDSRSEAFMSEETVALLLAVNGFKIVNFTERNGLTYFHSKKVKPSQSLQL